MKEILIISHSGTDILAMTPFVLKLAAKRNAGLVIADFTATRKADVKKTQAVYTRSYGAHNEASNDLMPKRPELAVFTADNKQAVRWMDCCEMNEQDLINYVLAGNVDLVISVVPVNATCQQKIKLQNLLDRLICPLLLIPEGVDLSGPDRIAYLTDMRYCQTQVLRTLEQLASTSVLLTHKCYSGLPDLETGYAQDLFKDLLLTQPKDNKLFFTHIRENQLLKTTDVLINGINIDMLACVNRQPHFYSLLGSRIPETLPNFISVPLLIFPF